MRSDQRDGLRAAVRVWGRIGWATLVAIFCLAGPTLARADFEGNPFRSVTLTCSFSDHQTFAFETAEVRTTPDDEGQAAGSKTFRRGETGGAVNFRVKPGETAECLFPSGQSVRVKTGEELARPYGMCGADPEIFSSIWVNGRKIASREWFAGHCIDEDSTLAYKISLDTSLLQKCQAAVPEDAPQTTIQKPKAAVSVCVTLPDLRRYPVDSLEYPSGKQKRPAVGEIELLQGHGPVCSAARKLLKAQFYFLSWAGDVAKQKSDIVFPKWEEAQLPLPKALAGSEAYESSFDLNNDGRPERVILKTFQTHYMDGDTVLFKSGAAGQLPSLPEEMTSQDWTFYPCQLSAAKPDIANCAPFSQATDDASFAIGAGRSLGVFNGRYTHLTPFRFRGASYIGVNRTYDERSKFAAVIRPMPHKRWAPVCLFRKVTEHF